VRNALSEVAAKDDFASIKNANRDDILAAHRVPPSAAGDDSYERWWLWRRGKDEGRLQGERDRSANCSDAWTRTNDPLIKSQ